MNRQLHHDEVHYALWYEYKEFRLAEVRLKFLSTFLTEIDGMFGEDWNTSEEAKRSGYDDKIFTYGMGMTFRDLNEKEYKAVRKILRQNPFIDLGNLKKDSNITGLSLKGRVDIGQVVIEWENRNNPDEPHIDTKPVEFDISFEWGLPDTCEVVETVVEEPLTDKNYVIRKGKQYVTSVKREIKCNKPMLQSVFDAQRKREANADMV